MARYYLIGICGTAMASLAGLLKSIGHEVMGSDANIYPPMSTQLAELGIEVRLGYKKENLHPRPDYVVIGNAIPRGNPEVEYVLNERLHYLSMPEVLKELFIRGRYSIVVAGTHGKTTTTTLMAWVMEVAGLNPSFLIGGVAENFGTSFRATDGKYFVIEGDEYDTAFFDKGPKFMHYLPDMVILNNVEYDHADIYPDTLAYRLAFRRLINLIPSRGRLVCGYDSPVVRELALHAPCSVDSFATDYGEAVWQATVLTAAEETAFRVHKNGKFYGDFVTSLAGRFNIRNCLAVVAAADALGVARKDIEQALATFRSVKRRMQMLASIAGVTVIDDFAHHPTAVRETLEAISERYPGRRLVAVFEPRSWSSRKRVFQKEYESAFDAARMVVIADVFESFKLSSEDRFSPGELAEALRLKGKKAWAVSGVESIVELLETELQPGDVVVVMSNGSFGGIHSKILDMLKLKS
ncbi:MAG: UDP-N-acetylmuramate:L-alanyl-gamma-D-glutamyl-meso-diaminopimelate ligase [Acidobacteriota bacterium]|nr:UDP-N-acetylmuramate:L-alanyl-gamma-D-glutamyl-meso-diaminopimelate ligase [Blastocatellia bacterium]MDW8412069.1 UDP-N-acetylmuramate:L-alanyl-gamma-D-glutamyl-meso-diaminopimelate ligase [Acidobacteriota bacterium]